MKLRLATPSDLDNINHLFKELISDMHMKKITIWGDHYPFFMFKEDIALQRMYLVEDSQQLISVFVIAKENNGESAIEWENKHAKVYYLDRFAVNVNYLRKGIGSQSLALAKQVAKELGGEYLRLFVVGSNIPAIKLYEKRGFIKRPGLFTIPEEPDIKVMGYEIKL